MKLKESKVYSAHGGVLGTYWGGGTGGYPSEEYIGYTNKSKLMAKIRKDFKTGALDSGMGYQELIAAAVTITKTITIRYENELYNREECEVVFIGRPTEEEKGFLQLYT